jgi:hypothetical protein
LRPTSTTFVTAVDHRVEVGHHAQIAIRLGDALALHHQVCRRPRRHELDVRALNVRPRERRRFQRSTSLRRDCTWLERVPAKSGDEVVQLRDLLFALRVVGLDARPDLRLGQHHVVVAADVGDDRLVVDVRDVRADLVQEMAIVRDHDQRAVVTDEELAEPVDRVEVQMVRRLVEQQRVRMAEQRLCEQDRDFLPALQLRHLPLVQLVRDVQALQKNRRIAFSRVAVFFADDALELAEADAVFVSQVRLGVRAPRVPRAPATDAGCP